MRDNQPQEIHLKDYQAPCYLVDTTHLEFELNEESARVTSILQLRHNPDWPAAEPRPLMLDGAELELLSLSIDGQPLTEADYVLLEEGLRIDKVPKNFELECVTLIKPHLNTSLEGLYKSSSMFCTQCEAEGFRKITYYPDRPDVMSVFTTRVEADKQRYPVLLSNGNDVDRGEDVDGDNPRHWVTWHDPHPKPAYLFALVAGDLVKLEDRFTTCNDRDITLQIFVEPENLDKCDYAMDSLKRAMRWDEEVYGREYDLDKFMIVAVSDFNMGAMENKGLNIFNSSCVLARPDTTTDAAYQRVEGVVAHEYFHNWSGNRVTCRDWFQLSLKEGFTVFRDQEFSADMGSRAVQRIDEATLLRTAQFAEDAGPMAHPVRPESYMEISNFYTLTVYEKGAELVRMVHRLLGPERFRAGSDLYFERHDGQAVTTDDFIAAMADASGVDLIQFKRWYSQVGTPVLRVTDDYDAEQQLYRLTVQQQRPDRPTPAAEDALHIPLALGLLDSSGHEVAAQVLEVTENQQCFEFAGIAQRPLPSLLRGFSAPVKLEYEYSRDDLMFLMQHDQDGFNRWDAGQKLAIAVIQDAIIAFQQGSITALESAELDTRLVTALQTLLTDTRLDKAMVARMLLMPSEAYLSELAQPVDVEAIHQARQFVRREIAQALRQPLLDCYRQNLSDAVYTASADAIAQRSLKNACLHYLMLLPEPEILELCQQQFTHGNNMTDVNAALIALVHSGYSDEKAEALEGFYQQWQHDPLVIDSWFSIQASSPQPDAFTRVEGLLQHPAFTLTNPNRLRSVIGVFCNQNPINFHRSDGAGYKLLADKVIELNALNPQIAARLLTPLTRWRKYLPAQAEPMRGQLQRIHDQGELSKDVFEVVAKSL